MEPSKIFGDAEECHSSESGWTMYIGSPLHGDDDDDDDHSDDGDNSNGDDDGHDADDSDDDDSMASDASSGPSHREHRWGDAEGSHDGTAHFKNKEDEDDGKYCLDKKANKPMEKQRAERWKKEDKEEMVLMAKQADSSVQSGSKVRKNIWIGKRK